MIFAASNRKTPTHIALKKANVITNITKGPGEAWLQGMCPDPGSSSQGFPWLCTPPPHPRHPSMFWLHSQADTKMAHQLQASYADTTASRGRKGLYMSFLSFKNRNEKTFPGKPSHTWKTFSDVSVTRNKSYIHSYLTS